jgi:ketosteroid isomerase-like protein
MRIDGYPEIQGITVTGDQAICWNKLEITMTPLSGGASMKRSGSTLSVFRRGGDGQWRIWRDANMLGPVA